ncbi:cysteine hydrolase family protein [Pleionea sp. CnH1-48]|uniref:cysteine hydrolase family protein n=1 Tax=Pleionea sp. CnH1-48 TaxID=2954494 RepID=UPI002096B120|nr:cysteine hydrolase family protein [Pleionea sp. CnH1-48]MCO7226044.1 cysteine hydrolase [Pleionea sp. CnH1-48]
MSNTALLVIDLQNDYFETGKWPLKGINQATDNAAKLITEFRQRNDHVIHIRHEFESDDAPFFVAGSEGAQIHSLVAPDSKETVVVKHQVNAFLNTELKSVLDAKGITNLVIIGAMTHNCVEAATRAASDFGYQCTVIHDACATHDLEFNGATVAAEEVQTAVMAALGFAYATISSTQEFLQQ